MPEKYLDKVYTISNAPDAQCSLYNEWAETYDAELGEGGYATPARLAAALGAAEANRDAPVLDFGCGTGLSGAALAAAGFTHVRDLQALPLADLLRRIGSDGTRLARLARGEDDRRVDPASERKSVSAEQTFDADLSDEQTLLALLRHLSEKVSTRCKAAGIAGRTVTLKLKTPDFRTHSRAETLSQPTAMAHRIFAIGKTMLTAEAKGRAFRLIGIGVSHLEPINEDEADLFDPRMARLGQAERAMDRLRARFGEDAIATGLALSRPRRRPASPTDGGE